MSTRSADVPRFSYPVAVAVGLFCLPLIYVQANFVAGLTGEGYGGLPLAAAAIFAVLHAVPGAAFGLAWPDIRWRWGVWLCAVPTCIVSFLAPDAWVFLGWAAMTVLPSCAGAHAAASLHLKYAEVR